MNGCCMIDDKSVITIGITAYKDSDYLEMAINSVLNQTCCNWNGALVLDGGSDKKTKKIFDDFEHPKFQKYELLENLGPYGTRAKAIELSDTEWYYQLDGDDLLPSNAISDVISGIKNNPSADYVYGDCLYFDSKKSFIKKPSDNIENLCYSLQFNGQSPIRVHLFNRIGGFAPELYNNADWDFWISAYEIGAVGEKINKIIYHRRLRDGNVGSIYLENKPDNLEKIIIRHPKFFNVTRKKIARYKINELLARHFRSNGKREKAYIFAKKTEGYGILTPTLSEIIREYKMNRLRYFTRQIARRMNVFYRLSLKGISYSRYILFQRTELQFYRNWKIYSLLNGRKYNFSYKNWITIQSILFNNQILKSYFEQLQDDYNDIDNLLPVNAQSILDIGCGLGGVNLFISKKYRHNIKIMLLDKTKIDNSIVYNYRENASFYNSLPLAKDFLVQYGVPTSNITYKECKPDNTIPYSNKFDIVISLLSWGFHYPLNIYLDQVGKLLNNSGILIIDIREDSDGIRQVINYFKSTPILLKQTKTYQRIAIIKANSNH